MDREGKEEEREERKRKWRNSTAERMKEVCHKWHLSINCHCIVISTVSTVIVSNDIVSLVKDINCINFSGKWYNMPENMYFALGFWWFDTYFRIVFTVSPVKKLKNVSLSCVSWYRESFFTRLEARFPYHDWRKMTYPFLWNWSIQKWIKLKWSEVIMKWTEFNWITKWGAHIVIILWGH